MEYVLAYQGRNAVCPVCSGLLGPAGNGLMFRCNDCSTTLVCVGSGKGEKDLVYREVEMTA